MLLQAAWINMNLPTLILFFSHYLLVVPLYNNLIFVNALISTWLYLILLVLNLSLLHSIILLCFKNILKLISAWLLFNNYIAMKILIHINVVKFDEISNKDVIEMILIESTLQSWAPAVYYYNKNSNDKATNV